MLETVGCDFAFEVRSHGRLVDDPIPLLAMLWHADMICDREGVRCTYDERLAGARERYGRHSRQAVNELARRIVTGYDREMRLEPQSHDDELRDCPTCLTGRPVIDTAVKDYGHGPRRVRTITCFRCLTSTRFYNERQDAIDTWNGDFERPGKDR